MLQEVATQQQVNPLDSLGKRGSPDGHVIHMGKARQLQVSHVASRPIPFTNDAPHHPRIFMPRETQPFCQLLVDAGNAGTGINQGCVTVIWDRRPSNRLVIVRIEPNLNL